MAEIGANVNSGAVPSLGAHNTQNCHQTVARPEKKKSRSCICSGLLNASKALTGGPCRGQTTTVGIVAQLMGHKPSATAEKHNTVRPLDLLRVHHERIEAWVLERAGVMFDRTAEPG